MTMCRGKVSGFAIAIAVVLTFQQQDAVYAQNNSTLGNSSYIFFNITPTSELTPLRVKTVVSSSMQNTSAVTQTSENLPTSSDTTSTTGTTSSTSVTTSPPTTTLPPKKTCGLVSATVDKNKPPELQKFLEDFYFNDTKKYIDVEITDLEEKEKNKISFKVCLNFNSTGYFEDDAVTLLKGILSVSNVKAEITGVDLSDWKATKCDTCSNGAGGPFDIERECNDAKTVHSCKGVKVKTQTEQCVKYCSKSDAVSFMVSYLLSMGIALSFSFYL